MHSRDFSHFFLSTEDRGLRGRSGRNLFRTADYLVAENDTDLAVGTRAFDRLESGLFRRMSIDSLDIILEFAHQEQDPDDREGPDDEDAEEERLVGSHSSKCRV